MFKSLWQGLLNLVYPPACILCQTSLSPVSPAKELLCRGCQQTIVPNKPPFCRQCSRPLTDHFFPHCRTCRRKTIHFDRAWGACIYNDTVKHLVYKFKYGGKTILRNFFSACISDCIERYTIPLHEFDLIIPVPLHPVRLRERGFNQSQLMAEIIAQKYSIPLSVNNLQRIRHTQNQARVSQKERWTNIRSAFKIKNSDRMDGKKILVIDDLYTTGATLSEIARLLKAHGASKVCGLTFAIAVESQNIQEITNQNILTTAWTL